MEKPTFWNHNAAYYPWVRELLDRQGAKMVLDVGCGEGSLARYLASPGRNVLGIDPDPAAIAAAWEKTGVRERIGYLCVSFEDYDAPSGSLDAVIFVASLHHMEGEAAIRKAKALLKPGGQLLVAGMAAPSGPLDWALAALRVPPAWLGTLSHGGETTSEELGLQTSYTVPKMAEVRSLIRRELPGAKLHNGLYYRYLLSWTK